MSARPARAGRLVAIAVLAVLGALSLASCSDDGPAADAVRSASSLAADVSAPDVSLPDVSLPDVTAPDVTAPDVTAPNSPVTTTAPANAAPVEDSGQSDDGLGPWGIAVLVLLALGILGTIVALVRGGHDSSDAKAQERRRLYASLNQLIDDGNWAMRQAAEAVRATDLDRVAAVWPSARTHFIDIERSAADLHPDSEAIAEAVQRAGLAFAALRGSLDAYTDAIRRGSLGQLDALGSLQERVTGRQDNLAVQLQALASTSSAPTV